MLEIQILLPLGRCPAAQPSVHKDATTSRGPSSWEVKEEAEANYFDAAVMLECCVARQGVVMVACFVDGNMS